VFTALLDEAANAEKMQAQLQATYAVRILDHHDTDNTQK
jgi:hypothetical protein